MTAAPTINCTASGATTGAVTSGATFAIGTTSVNCTAKDAANNTSTAKIFTITVKSAATQLTELKAAVTTLPPGTSLADKAQAALTAAQAGNTTTACGALREFLNEVRAQEGKKLTKAQAQQLSADATRIRAVLGCR